MAHETKWTKGPWHAVVVKGEGAKIVTTSSFEMKGQSVAWVPADDTAQLASGRIVERMSERAQANARLIAQAPAMMEVIQSITWRGHADGCDARRGNGAVFEGDCNCLVRQARSILAAIEGKS